MSINWSKLVSTANSFTSPQKAINFLLNKIGEKDKAVANSLQIMINNNEDPSKALTDMASKGKINLNQLADVKKYYNIAKKFGLKQTVPNEIWKNAEQIIRSASNNNKQFNGF